MNPRNEKKIETRNVAKALADVPIDNKMERDVIRAQLREKYAELKAVCTENLNSAVVVMKSAKDRV